MAARNHTKLIAGITLLVIGIVALFVVYSMRPPQDIGDAIHFALNSRDHYFKQPTYSILLGLSVASAVLGLIFTVLGLRARK